VDVLFHLRKEELFQRAEEAEPDPTFKGENKDSMAALARHIVSGKNFYPIFPPPETVAGEVNLDVTHYPLLKMDVQPDILILPSRLKHFSKVSRIAVWPAR
jgi:DNA polymerase alpha subunit B